MIAQLNWFEATALGDRMVALVDSPHFAPVALGVAFVAGAAHAVGPGHGKSLAAAYLVGSDGRVRDAAWLGGSVAVMHTVSVLVLAVAWTFFDLSGLIELEELTSVLQVIAGVLVIGLGVWLVRQRIRTARAGDHGHGHGHEVRRPSILLLGVSGGLTPSPAAFLVLVSGLFSGRSGLALVLVVVFGLGLASVLFTVGLLALAGKSFVIRMTESPRLLTLASRVAPVLAAVSITAIGGVIATLGATNLVAAV